MGRIIADIRKNHGGIQKMEYVDLVNVTPIRVAINTETIPGLG